MSKPFKIKTIFFFLLSIRNVDHPDILRVLLENGANVNCIDDLTGFILHTAIYLGNMAHTNYFQTQIIISF